MRHKEVPAIVREGSLKAEVYNEALCAYLCDESHEAEIGRIIDAFEEEFPTEDSDGMADFRPLADRGLLLTYELYQDDSLLIHIAVGEPATTEEKKAVPMLKALRGFLSLPTGKLKIHSANTAPWEEVSVSKLSLRETNLILIKTPRLRRRSKAGRRAENQADLRRRLRRAPAPSANAARLAGSGTASAEAASVMNIRFAF